MSSPPPPSITTWTRLEPRARGDSLAPALEARVYDPAWMLAMQALVAEFRGQDAAFPVQVSFTVQVHPLGGYQPASAGPQYPLEAFAWPAPASALTSGTSGEFGAELLRLLGDYGCSPATIAKIAGAYPLAAPSPPAAPGQVAADQQGVAYLTLLAGRLPDTTQLEPALRAAIAAGSFPPSLGIPSQDLTAVTRAATDWLAELDSFALASEPAADPWQPGRLEHQFSVTVGSVSGPAFSLLASAWPGRRLEWSDFDVAAQPADAPPSLPVLPGVDPATGTISGTGPPHPLVCPGTPERRIWTIEDANYNLAAVTGSTDDLARMLIIEFASVYANDWYMQPIPLPCGALHTITQLTVTDSYGETENLGPAAPGIPAFGSSPATTQDWCVFRLTAQQADGGTALLNGLLLIAGAADVQTSPPVEEVVLIRDDTADLGWAVEHTVLGADDRPLDRYAAAAQQAPAQTPAPPPDDGSAVRYLLETDVPVFCYPLVPDPHGQPLLDLLVLRRVGTDGQQQDVPPQGQLLTALQGQPLFDQELPAVGTTARRRCYLIRGFDGEPLLWTGRERQTGGRYGSIPLAFDQIVSS
jgi:hypothetical protein